ncbi:MAG: ACP S-malonyltransferase [candidate division NC10 bacterium]|nr:ACP S-malonyltransferase [candidate division NC10 bacterium]
MRKIAFVFPGQGSQYVGMGRDFHERYPLARASFEKAEEVLGFSIRQVCFEGPEETLRMTANTQPALLVCSFIAFRLLEEAGIQPDFVAGHSLGEYSALLASGSIDFSDAVALVRKRGEWMQEAVPLGKGAMAAILGMEREAVFRVCEEARDGQVVEVANLNAPGQIVISGEAEAVGRAVGIARGQGAKKAILLPVSAPFHCRLMRPAGERLGEVLAKLRWKDPRVPLVTNVDAQLASSAVQLRSALLRQATSPVLWEDSIRRLQEEGVNVFVEVGPGKVLSGLIKRIVQEATLHHAEDEESLRSTIEILGGGA